MATSIRPSAFTIGAALSTNTTSASIAAPSTASTPAETELPEEQSDAFFKGIGVVFVQVDGDTSHCDLCSYSKDHPPPPAPTESLGKSDNRWGIMHHIVEQRTLCQVKDEHEQHAFHVRCLRSFIANNKNLFREDPGCPTCNHYLTPGSQPQEEKKDGDELDFALEEVGALGGKARKRDQLTYSCWVHIIQATGLKKPGSDAHIAPICYISAFGKTLKSEIGDHGKTFSCVWDQAFSFTGKFDSDTITRQSISIRIEDYRKVWANTLIGSVQFQAQHVNAQPNHEFYRIWTPIVHVGGKDTKMQLGMQGSIQVSVCVLSEADIIANPRLPLHVYDLEVQMFQDGDHKKIIEPVDTSNGFLQKQVDEQKALDLMRTCKSWDLIHIKIFRGEDLPKVDRMGWCDGFVELTYKGLLQNKKLCTEVVTGAQPMWNHEFTIPIVSGQPVFYNRFDLVLKDYNTVKENKTLGGCWFNITDILALNSGSKPFWKNLYQDEDGRAPVYRGRILVQMSVETNVPSARIGSVKCAPLSVAMMPPTGSYKLDIEMFEGCLLGGRYDQYQVDVAWAHSLKGGESDAEREKAGKIWTTFHSKPIQGKQRVVPFLTRQTVIAHNLPYPEPTENKETDKGASSVPILSRAATAVGITTGYTGDSSELINSTSSISLEPDTCRHDYISQIPDIIIYVSKKGDRKNCVGYLRIPVSGVTRPTENWEHGQDLTIFPNLWDAKTATPRCLPLKPLKELYEVMYGFLSFKLSITPISNQEAQRALAAPPPSQLAPIPRQMYQLIANIYQAKDLASVDSSGLSSPFATVRIMDVHVQSQPKPNTCFPLWFQCLTANVELPVDLTYAPDLSVTVFHNRPGSIFRWGDPSIFMGKADITALTAHPNNTHTAWYPLQFEEHSYGDICCSFVLTPVAEANARLRGPADDMQSMIEKWDNYKIDVQALALRGTLAQKLARTNKDAKFEMECWGKVQTFTQSQVINDSFSVKLRKPSNPVYYSSINIRIYEDTQLIGVTSIPIQQLLKSGLSWYRLVELLMRTPERMARKYIRKWKQYAGVTGVQTGKQEGGKVEGKSKFSYLRQTDVSHPGDVVIDIDAPEQKSPKTGILSSPRAYGSIDDIDIVKVKTAAANALQPRMGSVDKEGNEIFDPQQIQNLKDIPTVERKQGGKVDDPWDRVWRTECEYELLPLTKEPFDNFSVFTGKDEIHQTFLEKLFARSKHSVGMLRGHFGVTRLGKYKDEQDEKHSRINLFESQRYAHPEKYQIRVYILRGLSFHSESGAAADCDPFIRITLGDGVEIQKSKIQENTANPAFFQCLQFGLMKFPGEQTTLNISAWNDSGMFGEDLIGESTLDLENRIFSTTWWNTKRPIERRALFSSKFGRLPRGYLEVCIEIVPEAEIGQRNLDFLLNPPTRQDWELRCILWQTRNVTPKKIYRHEGDCCCVDLCAPPNQSDIQLVCGFSGSKEKPSATDIHVRSVDGEGLFNWRTRHTISLPVPEPLAHFKVQVWNINWNPDDCIAEAVMPLWGWLEFSRRAYDAQPDFHDKWVHKIPRQWIHLTHPHNTDQGDVELEMELIPATIAQRAEFRAAVGKDGFDSTKNSSAYLLLPPQRPETSFAWYRMDKQICFRCGLCWKKSRKWLCLLLVIFLFVTIGLPILFNNLKNL